jgi:hypothetical protein
MSNQTHQQRRRPDRNTRLSQTLDRCDKAQWRLHWRTVNVFCKINSFLKRKHTVCRTSEMTHQQRRRPDRNTRLPQTLDRCDKAQWRLHWWPVNVFCKINSFLKTKHTVCRTSEMTHVLCLYIISLCNKKNRPQGKRIEFLNVRLCSWGANHRRGHAQHKNCVLFNSDGRFFQLLRQLTLLHIGNGRLLHAYEGDVRADAFGQSSAVRHYLAQLVQI